MLNKRLQVLVDEARLRRLTAHAERQGISVGEAVRRAVDLILDDPDPQRAKAVKEVLEADRMPVPDPAELRREFDELRSRRS